MSGLKLREYLDRQSIFERPTQVTDAIKPVIKSTRLVHTDKLPSAQQSDRQPVSVVHIASVQVPLANLTDVCQERVLHGFKMAYLYQRIALLDALYVIRDVYFDPYHSGKIYARMEREDG